jgi:hypothetical protein
MALSGSDQAYLYARSNIARSGATRSNYVAVLTTIEWITRDGSGHIVTSQDLSGVIIMGTLHVTQAINDEPDTCSFEIRPQDPPAAMPKVGDEIRVSWAPGGPPIFHGYILVAQQDWRLANMQPPWMAIQCQDPMWRFDARIVTYRFPAQSVTDSIRFLVQWFCNLNPDASHPLDFLTSFVQPGMPSVPAFDVVNQRPSTVMRTLTASVGGGFYIDGLTVHAWAGSVSEPGQTNPTPLTVGLSTLKSFRLTTDATQVRRRVLVEGKRTATMIGFPDTPRSATQFLGLPLDDVESFPPGIDVFHLTRIGTQWMILRDAMGVTVGGANPPQAKVNAAFTPGGSIILEPINFLPPAKGWIRVGNQYSQYNTYDGDPLTGPWALLLPAGVGSWPYGQFTEPIPAGDTVEWVDGIMAFEPHGLQWGDPPHSSPTAGDLLVRSHPPNTPVVTVSIAQDIDPLWPPLEGFVQDGRYSYAGGQARADADLAAFKDPLVAVEWDTDDHNAAPGRSQVIALSSATVDPPINLTVTILRVDLSFPLRTLPPRRSCYGGIVKPSSFMDLVLTTTT